MKSEKHRRYLVFIVRIIFFPFAVFFTLACLFVHVTSLFGIDCSEYIPPLYIVILSLLLIHIPSLILQETDEKRKEEIRERSKQKGHWKRLGKLMFRQTPKWIKKVINYYLIYAAFNFFYFPYVLITNYEGGEPVVENNEYQLENHGKVIKKMTTKEVEEHRTMMNRFISGHLLLIYLGNFAALYPRLEKKEDDEDFEEVKKDKPLS